MKTLADALRRTRQVTGYGVARSLLIFYGRPWRFRIMDTFYARLIRPGDLCFDLGAHVGNRVRSWRKLGARVVAVEPQPALARVLRVLYGRDADVHLVAAAVAAHAGEVELHLNLANPMVSTVSPLFIERAAAAPSFATEVWRRRITVPATTIDALISTHGVPRFIKIDVEGYEAEALRGLSQPVYALSVEFVPMARAVAEAALDRLEALAGYVFNASYGDEMRLLHQIPLSGADIRTWLRSLDDDGPAGDLYACLEASPISASQLSGGRQGRRRETRPDDDAAAGTGPAASRQSGGRAPPVPDGRQGTLQQRERSAGTVVP